MKDTEEKEKAKNINPIGFLLQGFGRKMGFLLLVLLLGFCFYGGIRLGRMIYGKSLTKENAQITDTLLYQQLERDNELSTVKYFYTNMGKYENSIQVGNTQIPFTRKSFIISYDGVIKAGIDMNRVTVHVDDRTITVSIPAAEILSHEVDEDSVKVYDEKNSIFNGLSTEDVTNFQKEQKKEMEQKAVGSGILKEAEENAERSLKYLYTAFLENGQYGEDYVLKFDRIKE